MLAALKSAGVDESDIKTQSISVSPSYAEEGQIDGYMAGNSVSVKIHDLSKAGDDPRRGVGCGRERGLRPVVDTLGSG